MRKLAVWLFLLALSVAPLTSQGQTVNATISTNNVRFDLTTFGLLPNAVARVTIQALYWQADTNRFYVNPPQILTIASYPQLTNGSVVFSNQVCGVPFQVTFSGYQLWTTNYFIPYNAPTNSDGTVSAAPYVGQYASPVAFYYSFLNGFNFTTNYLTITNTVNVTNVFNLTNNVSGGTNLTAQGTNAVEPSVKAMVIFTPTNYDAAGAAQAATNPIPGWITASTNPITGWIQAGTNGGNIVFTNALPGLTNKFARTNDAWWDVGGTAQAATNPIAAKIIAATNPIPGWITAATNPIPGWITAPTNGGNIVFTNALPGLTNKFAWTNDGWWDVGGTAQAATNPIPGWIVAATNPIAAKIIAATNPIPGWITAATNPIPGWITAPTNGGNIVFTNALPGLTNKFARTNDGWWDVGGTAQAATNPIPSWIIAATNPIPGWIQAGTNGGNIVFFVSLPGITNKFARTNDAWWDVGGTAQAATNPIAAKIIAATNPVPGWIIAATNPVPSWIQGATNPIPGWIQASTNGGNIVFFVSLPGITNKFARTNDAWWDVGGTAQAATNPIAAKIIAATNPIPGWITAATNPIPGWITAPTNGGNIVFTNALPGLTNKFARTNDGWWDVGGTAQAATNPIAAKIIAATNPVPGMILAQGAASTNFTMLLVTNQAGYVQAMQAGLRLSIFVSGAPDAANVNGTNVWASLTSWTNVNGIGGITNDLNGSRIFASGIGAYGFVSGYPSGTTTNIAGSSPAPTASFLPIVAGGTANGITNGQPAVTFGNVTASNLVGALDSSNLFNGFTAALAFSNSTPSGQTIITTNNPAGGWFLGTIPSTGGSSVTNAWSLSGNTIGNTNFIGSLNSQPVYIVVNGYSAARFDSPNDFPNLILNPVPIPGTFANGSNSISGEVDYSFVAGGDNKIALNIVGGSDSILGGAENVITNGANRSSIINGQYNTVSSVDSMAAGTYASAINDQSFVWNDTNINFSTTTNRQFLVHASNGVGINTNNPNGNAVEVLGNVDASGFSIAGVNITNYITNPINGVTATAATNIAQGVYSNNPAGYVQGPLIPGVAANFMSLSASYSPTNLFLDYSKAQNFDVFLTCGTNAVNLIFTNINLSANQSIWSAINLRNRGTNAVNFTLNSNVVWVSQSAINAQTYAPTNLATNFLCRVELQITPGMVSGTAAWGTPNSAPVNTSTNTSTNLVIILPDMETTSPKVLTNKSVIRMRSTSNGKLFAFDGSVHIYMATDGIGYQWTTLPWTGSSGITDGAYMTNGVYVFCGGGSGVQQIFTTTDLTNFVGRGPTTNSGIYNAILFDVGRVLAVGEGQGTTSTDGTNFTTYALPDELKDIASDHVRFVCPAVGVNYCTTNGVNWATNVSNYQFNGGANASCIAWYHHTGNDDAFFISGLFTSGGGMNWYQTGYIPNLATHAEVVDFSRVYDIYQCAGIACGGNMNGGVGVWCCQAFTDNTIYLQPSDCLLYATYGSNLTKFTSKHTPSSVTYFNGNFIVGCLQP